MKRVRCNSTTGPLLKPDKFKEVPTVSSNDVASQEVNGAMEVGKEIGEIVVEDRGVFAIGVVDDSALAP